MLLTNMTVVILNPKFKVSGVEVTRETETNSSTSIVTDTVDTSEKQI